MAQTTVSTPTTHVNTSSTYRLAGSCSVRAYVNCDDTPYHLEQPVITGGDPNPNYNRALMETVRALRATREGRCRDFRVLRALVEANPEATVAELINLLSQ